jgi:hypothetical protein
MSSPPRKGVETLLLNENPESNISYFLNLYCKGSKVNNLNSCSFFLKNQTLELSCYKLKEVNIVHFSDI